VEKSVEALTQSGMDLLKKLEEERVPELEEEFASSSLQAE